MRSAVGLLLVLVFFALSGCGNKGSLYLPTPEQKQQQDSKPAPRQ
jgi:predicted small lipoprotein YifL